MKKQENTTKTNIKAVVFLAIFVCFSIAASILQLPQTACGQQKFITVTVEGEAPIINGDKVRAKDEAKRNAYRNAIEKAIGAYVEGITQMENFMVVKDRVFSHAQGLVTDFKILKEWVDKDNILHLKVKCKVSVKKLDGVLGPAVIDALGNPRVMVVVKEEINNKKPFLPVTEGEILKIFQKAGYMMVDPQQVEALRGRELELAKQTQDIQKLKELAKTFDADVLIYGVAQSEVYSKQKISGQTLYGVRSRLQLKAILTQTAQIIATEVPEVKKVGVSPEDGATKGLKIAASKAAKSLIHKVAYALVSGTRGGVPGRVIKVKIEGLKFKDALRIKSAISQMRGVVGVYQRNFTQGKLELDVNTEGNAEDLAVRLEELGLEITGLTANTIEAKFIKKEGEK